MYHNGKEDKEAGVHYSIQVDSGMVIDMEEHK